MSEFYLADMVRQYRPRVVVELGVGDGAMAERVMTELAPDGRFVGVNWPSPPSGDRPERFLYPWLGDPRLTIIYGDTRDPEVVKQVPDGIELLHVDSTHTAECASEEWRLYAPKLARGAVVVFDDLNHNDMRQFWDGLCVLGSMKQTILGGRVGILRAP